MKSQSSYHQLAALLVLLILTLHDGIVCSGGVMSTLRKQHRLSENSAPSQSPSESTDLEEAKQSAPSSPSSSAEGDFILVDLDPQDRLLYESQTKAQRKKKKSRTKTSTWLRLGRWNQPPSPKLRSRSASPIAQHYYPNSEIINSYLDDRASLNHLQKRSMSRGHRRSKSSPHLPGLARSKSLDHSDLRGIKKSPSHGAVPSIPFSRPSCSNKTPISQVSSDSDDEFLSSLSHRHVVSRSPPSFSSSSSEKEGEEKKDVPEISNVVLDTSHLRPKTPKEQEDDDDDDEDDSTDRPSTPPNSPHRTKKKQDLLTSSLISNMSPEFRRLLHQRLRAMGVCGQLAQIKEHQVQSSSSVDDLLTPQSLRKQLKTSHQPIPSSSLSKFIYTPSQATAAAASSSSKSRFPFLHSRAAMLLCDTHHPTYLNKELYRLLQTSSDAAAIAKSSIL